MKGLLKGTLLSQAQAIGRWKPVSDSAPSQLGHAGDPKQGQVLLGGLGAAVPPHCNLPWDLAWALW